MSQEDKAYIVQLVKQIVHPYFAGEIADILIAHGMTFKTEPQTNADRIRAMSDEELAKVCVKEFPMYLWPSGVRTIYFDMDNHNKNNAVKAWLKWLQQPAEED